MYASTTVCLCHSGLCPILCHTHFVGFVGYKTCRGRNTYVIHNCDTIDMPPRPSPPLTRPPTPQAYSFTCNCTYVIFLYCYIVYPEYEINGIWYIYAHTTTTSLRWRLSGQMLSLGLCYDDKLAYAIENKRPKWPSRSTVLQRKTTAIQVARLANFGYSEMHWMT